MGLPEGRAQGAPWETALAGFSDDEGADVREVANVHEVVNVHE